MTETKTKAKRRLKRTETGEDNTRIRTEKPNKNEMKGTEVHWYQLGGEGGPLNSKSQ